MKSIVLSIVIACVSSSFAQSSSSDYTSSLIKSAIDRIQRTYGVTVYSSTGSLADLTDLEGRLAACARIKRSHEITFNFRTSSLASLLDAEARLDSCARLKRNHNLTCDYRSNSLSQLLDAESRIEAAQRVNRNYSDTIDWRTSSLSQILERERNLSAPATSTTPTPSYPSSSYTYTTPAPSSSPSTYNYTAPSTGGGYYSRYYDSTYRPAVGDHYVAPHIRSDGVYVSGHLKTNSDDSFYNNWSTSGNTNPYTGSTGYKLPPASYRSYTPSYTAPKSHSYGGSTYVGGYTKSNGTYVSGHYRKSK